MKIKHLEIQMQLPCNFLRRGKDRNLSVGAEIWQNWTVKYRYKEAPYR